MPQPDRPKRPYRRWIIAGAAAVLFVIAIASAGMALLHNRPEPLPGSLPTITPASDTRTSTTPTATATVTSNAPSQPPQLTVVTCRNARGQRQSFSILEGDKGLPDFSAVWAARVPSCDSDGARVPTTTIEKAAYDASGYASLSDGDLSQTGPDIHTLYDICAAAADPYADLGGPSFQLSAEQAAELAGALVLCPDHPFAATMRAEINNSLQPAPQPTQHGVHAGAFCTPPGAFGLTSAGTLMQCTATTTDSRYRWRAA